jgi:predicted metal-dependent HD superfamily phosphohydrolase
VNALDQDRWVALWRAISASGDPLPWFSRLATAYSEPHRHYHNQRHIGECFAEFDGARNLARHAERVELALWFHDAVYNPKASDNEEQSAALAERWLSEAGLTAGFIAPVSGLIMATKHHEVGTDEDAALMVDIDLSILGQPEERFLEYEAQIREEYAWVPRIIFGPKRAKILERFLGRERIYATEWFQNKYEQQARENLEASIRCLRRFFP